MAARPENTVRSAPDGRYVIAAGGAAEVELSVVVPTFNEAANIRGFIAAVCAVLDPLPLRGYELIVVDDDSPDHTWRLAAEAAAQHPSLVVVRRQHEHGLASAVYRGWQVARGEILGTINADFQHPPAILAPMLAALSSAELSVASRFALGGDGRAMPPHRRWTAVAANQLGRTLLPEVFGRVSDPLSGCYLLRRQVVAGVELQPLGFKSLIEVLAHGRTATIREHPYTMDRRGGGTSKLGPRRAVDYLAQLVRLRRLVRRTSARVSTAPA